MLGGVLKNTNRPRSSIPVAMFGVYTLSMHTPSRELIYRLYREVIYIFVIKAPHIFWLQCHPPPSPSTQKAFAGSWHLRTTLLSLEFQYTAAQHVVIFGPTRSLRSSHIHFIACSKRQPPHCAQQTTVEHIRYAEHIYTH